MISPVSIRDEPVQEDKKATGRHVFPSRRVELSSDFHRIPFEARDEFGVFIVDQRNESFDQIDFHGALSLAWQSDRPVTEAIRPPEPWLLYSRRA